MAKSEHKPLVDAAVAFSRGIGYSDRGNRERAKTQIRNLLREHGQSLVAAKRWPPKGVVTVPANTLSLLLTYAERSM